MRTTSGNISETRKYMLPCLTDVMLTKENSHSGIVRYVYSLSYVFLSKSKYHNFF